MGHMPKTGCQTPCHKVKYNMPDFMTMNMENMKPDPMVYDTWLQTGHNTSSALIINHLVKAGLPDICYPFYLPEMSLPISKV